MNIFQKLRRIGQQFDGLDNSIIIQSNQILLIKKLYAKNGLAIHGGGACPEQYDVYKDGKHVAYYRLRHGEFRVDYAKCGGETIYRAEPSGDGMFDGDERLYYLAKAMRIVLFTLSA